MGEFPPAVDSREFVEVDAIRSKVAFCPGLFKGLLSATAVPLMNSWIIVVARA
jgi:hypothetical protein